MAHETPSDERPDVISLGGNALRLPGKTGETVPSQRSASGPACEIVAETFKSGRRVAVVHGNGPQFGWILARSELAEATGDLHPVPCDAINADTQGAIGYMLANGILAKDPSLAGRVIPVVTQVIVDEHDIAFEDPSKPIGSFMPEDEAKRKAAERGWVVKPESKGWRRNVGSPKPLGIVEEEGIRHLVDHRFLTICGGGGGIPVVRELDGTFRGVDGVIDKDRTTALVARLLNARLMAVLTAAKGVIRPEDYAMHKEAGPIVPVLTVNQARAMIGELHKGSMEPKLEACADFVDSMGGEATALITDFADAKAALSGQPGVGTRIVYSRGHE